MWQNMHQNCNQSNNDEKVEEYKIILKYCINEPQISPILNRLLFNTDQEPVNSNKYFLE